MHQNVRTLSLFARHQNLVLFINEYVQRIFILIKVELVSGELFACEESVLPN